MGLLEGDGLMPTPDDLFALLAAAGLIAFVSYAVGVIHGVTLYGDVARLAVRILRAHIKGRLSRER